MMVYFKANDGEMLVNDGEMSIWSYTHFTIINKYFTIISLKCTIIRALTMKLPDCNYNIYNNLLSLIARKFIQNLNCVQIILVICDNNCDHDFMLNSRQFQADSSHFMHIICLI